MKVLIIDPWCNDNHDGYMFGLSVGLADKVDLTLVSNYYESKKPQGFNLLPLFFKLSEKMQRNNLRTILRGFEYILTYLKILNLVKQNKFDIIHIEWALQYKIDALFAKLLKKHCLKLIYTAHNAIPHQNGERYIKDLKRLHRYFDTVLVHGESIKQEYLFYFPEDVEKVKIQRHGIYLTQTTNYNIGDVDPQLINFVNKANGKVIVCIGNLFYNKGADRVLLYWLTHEKETPNRLIVAGRLSTGYKDLEKLIPNIKKSTNILFLPRFLNDDEFKYVCCHSDIITIPYRHASMSGLIYAAAAFSKPILYTDTGSISEYVGNDCCFRSNNSDEDFEKLLQNVLSIPEDTLVKEGKKLHVRIYENYSWDRIAEKLVKEIYSS